MNCTRNLFSVGHRDNNRCASLVGATRLFATVTNDLVSLAYYYVILTVTIGSTTCRSYMIGTGNIADDMCHELLMCDFFFFLSIRLL